MSRTIELGSPDWEPLEAAMSRERCADFMFIGSTGGIVLYKHRDTRRYLNIESETGQFYQYLDGDYTAIGREQAIEHMYGSRQI
jgi:hypothetical protein